MGNLLRISYGTSRDQKGGDGASASVPAQQHHNLPRDFGDRLDLKNQNLTDLPKVFIIEELTWLSLNHNAIESLPPEIANLTRLTIFRLFGNKLKSLPPEIGALAHLTTLDLGKNLLSSLPQPNHNTNNFLIQEPVSTTTPSIEQRDRIAMHSSCFTYLLRAA